MDAQRWDDRGRLTVRPEYRSKLGNPQFFQVLTPDGLLFVPIPDEPASWPNVDSREDHSKIAGDEIMKGWEKKNARIRRQQPRSRRR